MTGEESLYQKKRPLTLMEELQRDLKKETIQEAVPAVHEPVQQEAAYTKKGRQIHNKLVGLQVLTGRIRAQGTVVAADMLTDEMRQKYEQEYGLSKKELERMMGDLQRGAVPEDMLPDHELGAARKRYFRPRIRSKLLREQRNAERTRTILKDLGYRLTKKRWCDGGEVESFRMVTLSPEKQLQFQQRYGLSKKELEKLVMDFQTGSVSGAEAYDYVHQPFTKTVQDMERMQEELRLFHEKPEVRRQQAETEPPKQEDPKEQLRQARRQYLQTTSLARYADEVEKILKNSTTGGDPLKQETIVERVREIEERFLANMDLISRGLEEALSAYEEQERLPERVRRQLLARMRDEMEREHAPRLLRPNAESRVVIPDRNELYQKELKKRQEYYLKSRSAFEVLAIQLVDGRYQQRVAQIIHRGRKLNAAGHGFRITDFDREELDRYFDPDVSESDFEMLTMVLSAQIGEKLAHADALLKRKVFHDEDRQELRRMLREQKAEALIFGVKEDVSDAVEEILQQMPRAMRSGEDNTYAAMRKFWTAWLPDATKKDENSPYTSLNLVPEAVWQTLALEQLQTNDTPAQMEKKLRALIQRVHGNLSQFYLAYHRNRDSGELLAKLPEDVWREMFRFRDEHIGDKDFGSKMRERFDELIFFYKTGEVLDFGNVERFCMDDYLARQTADS